MFITLSRSSTWISSLLSKQPSTRGREGKWVLECLSLIANSTAILFLVCTSDHVFGYTCLDFVQINHYGVLPNGKDEIVNSDNIGIKNLLNEMVQTNASTCIDEMDQDQANIQWYYWNGLGFTWRDETTNVYYSGKEDALTNRLRLSAVRCRYSVYVCVHCLAFHCCLPRQGTGQVTLIWLSGIKKDSLKWLHFFRLYYNGTVEQM